MILGINTATHTHEMVILNEGKILCEKKWEDNRDDVENLVPFLEEMLSQFELNKNDIKQIVVVRGPGSFTALRTGIAFANALAEGLKAQLYTLDTFELMRRKAAIKDPVIVVLNAGGLEAAVSFEGEIKIGPIAELLAKILHNNSTHLVYELPETLHDELISIAKEKNWILIEGEKLQTFGEALLTEGLSGLQKAETVEPFYLKGPNITLSSDPWKKP
jgi:tRNA threonylcarbamoyl adenosine modification protein YeaZ